MQFCKICNLAFVPTPNSQGKFCSQQCYRASRDKSINKICKYCFSEFQVPAARDKTAKYCSWECKQQISGKNHENWRGGSQASWYRHTYSIELEDYDKVFHVQNGRCAICLTDMPGGNHNRFHLDHDHVTGKIRGLLCATCNLGLGYFKDNPIHLMQALHYILK